MCVHVSVITEGQWKPFDPKSEIDAPLSGVSLRLPLVIPAIALAIGKTVRLLDVWIWSSTLNYPCWPVVIEKSNL